MPLLIPLTWIVVVDGRHAKFWECRDSSGAIRLVPGMSFDASDQTSFSRALKSDRPGRVFASAGMRRSAVEPKSDPHAAGKGTFARFVANKLDGAFRSGQFQHLILVAPPVMLGHLRKELPDAIGCAVVGEVGKELAYQNADEISQRIKPFLLYTAAKA